MSPIRAFITANAVTGLVFGTVLILVPGFLTDLLDLNLDDAGEFVGRLLGAEMLGLNLAAWWLRNEDPPSEPMIAARTVNEILFVIVILAAVFSGIGNGLLAGLAVLPVIFAVGSALIALGIWSESREGTVQS